MWIVGSKEIIFSGEDVVDTGPARLHEQRGRDSAARRHATKMKSLLNMFGVAIPRSQAGGLMRGIAQHPPHLLSVQARCATRGRGRAKERRNAVGAPVALCLKTLTA